MSQKLREQLAARRLARGQSLNPTLLPKIGASNETPADEIQASPPKKVWQWCILSQSGVPRNKQFLAVC